MSKHLDLLACPDCRGFLSPIEARDEARALACRTCALVFPIIDGVYVLLGRATRSHSLENGPIQALLPLADADAALFVENTLAVLAARKGVKTWEWEDEEFWDREYVRENATTNVEKNWNDRLWQRERLVERVLHGRPLHGKTILDVGCGEGQNFRALLTRYCDDESLYVAVDISLAGLKLNRRRNPHKNSMYVLASANALPLRDASIDVLCYWGILHHTERQAATIAEDARLVRDGGFLFLHEGLDRASVLPAFLKPREEVSAHEHRIPEQELRAVLRDTPELEVLVWDEQETAIYTGIIRFFGRAIIKQKRLFWLVMNADSGLIPRLGPIAPFLRAGSVMMGARVNRPAKAGPTGPSSRD